MSGSIVRGRISDTPMCASNNPLEDPAGERLHGPFEGTVPLGSFLEG
jgi:hypothetical protein